jgi:SAM-dependent methyltransferase
LEVGKQAMSDTVERDSAARRHRLRAVFDESPELYDRTRPVCPGQLFDDLVSLAPLRPGARLLEIGCGTGQATLPLAERGFQIVGIELGEQLAALARRKLAAFPNVEIVNGSFEAWNASDARFDGVVVFHAIHWIDPDLRYAKPARLLRDEGVLAVVRSTYVMPDDADSLFWTEVQEDYDAINPGDIEGPPHPDAVGDLRAEIEASGHFRDVAVRRYLWSNSYTADEYIALLSTSSWHRMLDDESRQSLFDRIHRRIEARPDRTVRPPLLSTLNVARRL